MRFEVYSDTADQFRWRLLAANNRVVADSGESYTRETDANRAITTIQRSCSRIANASIRARLATFVKPSGQFSTQADVGFALEAVREMITPTKAGRRKAKRTR